MPLRSTESRPVEAYRVSKAGFPWDFHAQGVLSPAVPGEEPRWVLRDWRVRSPLQVRGVTGRREGVVDGTARVQSSVQLAGINFEHGAHQYVHAMRDVFRGGVFA